VKQTSASEIKAVKLTSASKIRALKQTLKMGDLASSHSLPKPAYICNMRDKEKR